MRHLDTPGEDMGGRLSRQRGGGTGRGASPRAAGQPSSRHFRLTAPRPSVLSQATNDDAHQSAKARHASSSPHRGAAEPVSRRGSGLGSSNNSGRGGGPGGSGHYSASNTSSSRRAVMTGSNSRPPVSYEDSLDADGLDGTTTPCSTGGGGGVHTRRSSGQGGAYFVSPAPSSGKQTTVQGGGTSTTVSARLHVPGLLASSTSSKRHASSSNSDRSRSTGRGGGNNGGGGSHRSSSPPRSSPHSQYDSVTAAHDYSYREGAAENGADGGGGRCRSAPPPDAPSYDNNRYADGDHASGAGSHREGNFYDDDQRHSSAVPGGGRRCVRSPGAGGGVTPRISGVGAVGRGSPQPAADGATGRGGGAGGGGAGERESTSTRGHNVVKRPGERLGQRADDVFSADAGQEVQQRTRSSISAVPSPTASRRDSTGIIDRSKFILENVGVLTDFYDVDSGTLGQGSYGSVAKARKKHTGQMRAIKTISKSQVKNLERFRQEIAIMKELVRLFSLFLSEEKGACAWVRFDLNREQKI